MRVDDEGTGGRRRVRVVGEIDLRTAPGLRDELDRLVTEGAREMDLDLSGVTFVDSSGLAVILRLYRRLEGIGRVRLLGPQSHVRAILELSGVPGLMDVVASSEETGGA